MPLALKLCRREAVYLMAACGVAQADLCFVRGEDGIVPVEEHEVVHRRELALADGVLRTIGEYLKVFDVVARVDRHRVAARNGLALAHEEGPDGSPIEQDLGLGSGELPVEVRRVPGRKVTTIGRTRLTTERSNRSECVS